MDKAILVNNGMAYDISGMVQTVMAYGKESGELHYRGNGIVAFRADHVDGNAVVFISLQGQRMIFGENVNIYTANGNWGRIDYEKYDMRASKPDVVAILPAKACE